MSKKQCTRVERTFAELLALDVVPIVNENVRFAPFFGCGFSFLQIISTLGTGLALSSCCSRFCIHDMALETFI